MTATESEASTFDRRLDRRQWEIPAWHTGGLSVIETLPRRCVHEMTIPSGLRDQFGAVAAGALGILCDSALGYAVMTTVPLPGRNGDVTSPPRAGPSPCGRHHDAEVRRRAAVDR